MANNNFITRNIPNFFTLLNLLSGAIAVILSFEGRNNLILAAYFIYAAALFDFFDGFAARTLKATSQVGKELDSMADLVSFGVAPSFILYQLMKNSMQIKQFAFSMPTSDVLILLAPLLIVLFSAIRLAKFNIDTRQTESFLGLATPACAMLIAAIPLIANFDPNDLVLFPKLSRNIYFFMGALLLGTVVVKPVVLVPLTVILATLLVVELPMFSLKFKNFGFEDNKLKYYFLIVSAILFACLQILSVPIIFLLYLTFSFFNNILDKRLSRRTEENLDRLFQEEV
jgi:CDP-diacylglycerol--serine O-phosphatidyltransferase